MPKSVQLAQLGIFILCNETEIAFTHWALWRNTCDSRTCPLCTPCDTGSSMSSVCTRDKCTVPVRPETRILAPTRSDLSPCGLSPWSPAKSWCSTDGRVQIWDIYRRPRPETGTTREPLPGYNMQWNIGKSNVY